MRTFQRYTCILSLIAFVVLIVVVEEFHLGQGYIYLANQYKHEVIEEITVSRTARIKTNIGVVIVLSSFEDEEKYQMALDTVRCYGRHFEYDVHVIHVENEKDLAKECPQKDFMFRRHCILSLKMPSISNSWLLFLDGDMGIVNPNHLIEDFIPKEPETQIVFYNRIMNHEVMAGSYLVKNSKWSRDFLMYWAKYEEKLPKSFHGSDNGAIHNIILSQGLPKLKSEREFCEEKFWKKSQDYEGLSLYEVCAQKLIKANQIPEIKILEKGRFSWARDGWLTNSVWSERDFVFHGWQKKRKDKLIFARWHSPLVYHEPWNLTTCYGKETHKNWRYKDSFIGSVVDVDRQILSTIQEQDKSYQHLEKIIEKCKN